MSRDGNFYKSLLDSLHDGVYFVDQDRRITYWSRGAERISGYASSEVVGMRCPDNVLMHINEKGAALCDKACPLKHTLGDGQTREAEIYLQHKDGHRVPVVARVSPLQDSNGRIVGAVETFTENSSKVALLQRIEDLQKMALLDPLTELANRRCVTMKLRSRLDELKRYGWPFGMLFIDIDNFKVINDRYGHSTGDRVLKMIARTLLSSLRSYDVLGRYGGEEFVAIIANVNRDQLYFFANRLRLLVEQSNLTTESGTLAVTISIGATLAKSNDSVDTVLRRADQLMYQSKTAGRNLVTMEQAGQYEGDEILKIMIVNESAG